MKKIYLTEEKSIAQRILEILVEVCLVVAVAFFLSETVFFFTDHNSKSMLPTIDEDAVVFTNRLSYSVFSPKRFDIVCFTRTEGAEEKLIRRVIGLPGETIRIYNGRITINGIPLDMEGRISEITSDGIARDDIVLGEGEYFVLGDRPANSEDSRSTTVGVVTQDQILGRAWLYGTSLIDIHFIH